MTSFTFLALLPFMFVIFLVAGIAIGLQLILVQITLMATDTFGIPMLSKKLVLGFPVMIEQDFLPALIAVTCFTLGTKVTFMGLVVLLLMAGHTGHLQFVLVNVTFMASRALNRRRMLAT